VGWLSQIGLFVMLGLLASPSRLPAQILPALLVGLVLVFLARPAAVVASMIPLRLLPAQPPAVRLLPHVRLPGMRLAGMRLPAVSLPWRRLPAVRLPARLAVSWREQAFLSWAGLRGAVPIVLTTIPLSARVPGATRLFDIVFIVVIVFTMVQGPTLPWVARRLGVVAPGEPLAIEVEAAPLEELHADLLQATVPEGSRLHGVEIYELRLPSNANLALIVRDGAGLVPGPTTVLRSGDRLLIVCPSTARLRVERRLRAVSRAGKLAGWYGEHGAIA
jgi:cell volume regulation protein A